MSTMEKRRLLTVKELAGELRLSQSFVYKLVEGKRIPFIRIGTQIRFAADTVDQWMAKQTIDIGGGI
jgi:excisionase family DNA binding protein